MKISAIFSILLAILVVVFSVENTAPVEVSFLKWSFTGSLALVMLLTFVAGMAAAFLASIPGWIKTKLELSKLRKAARPEKEP